MVSSKKKAQEFPFRMEEAKDRQDDPCVGGIAPKAGDNTRKKQRSWA